MTSRSATTKLTVLAADADLAIGVVTVDLATAAAEQAPPEWIKIAPRGDIRCRDGRSYTLDPEAVIARFAADGTRVPVDIGHATVKDDAAPAIAWIEEMQARSDGLWGRVEWLPGGTATLKARTHRYVSPAFHHDSDHRATWIHSVALVAAPALGNMPALASARTTHQEPSMKSIATALGLRDDANEAACLSALNAGWVKKDVHETTLAQLSTVTGRLTALEKANHDAEVDRTIEDALKAKKMLPAQKPAFVAMAATAEGLVSMKAVLAATAEGSFATASGLDARERPGTGDALQGDPVALAAAGVKLAGERNITLAEAISILTTKKAA